MTVKVDEMAKHWWIGALLVTLGCGGSDDADAGGEDSGTRDAPEGRDAPEVDQGVEGDGGPGDSGDEPDGSATDSGGADSGEVDAGDPDAGGPVGARIVSYIGDSSTIEIVGDQTRDVVFDDEGNLYVVGGLDRYDDGLFTGAGGRRVGTLGDEDIFVIKVDPVGALVYATLIGGPGYDRPYGVEVDSMGRVYVAGRAGNGFPTTTGALQETFAGDDQPNGAYGTQDGFVMRLTPEGAVDWATYLGDGGRAFIRDLDIDAAGDVYVGLTVINRNSTYATAGSFGPTRASGDGAMIVRLREDGAAVVWGGYLGGSGAAGGTPSVRVGPTGDVFVVCSTSATDEATTSGAFQSTRGGGMDALLTRIRGDGTALVYNTYVGGSMDDFIETHHLEVDDSNQAVIAFSTASRDLPTTSGALQAAHAGGPTDLWVGRLSADGSTLQAATYLGGSDREHSEGVALDPRNQNVVLTGSSRSTDLALMGSSPRSSGSGVVVVLSPDLSGLLYAETFSGAGAVEIRGVDVDSNGAVGAGGRTEANDLATMNAIQPSYGGGPFDAWFFRLPSY